jgi:multiple sugar transport system substrate-binding protein
MKQTAHILATCTKVYTNAYKAKEDFNMKRRSKFIMTGIIISTMMLAGCGGQAASIQKSSNPKKPYEGQQITVANATNPPDQASLAQFTKDTGIKVHWVNIGWDSLQTKITAAATSNTYFADVVDVDWSRVGEYNKTKWFTPLNQYMNPNSLKSDVPQLDSFTANGQLIGVPVDASIMVTTVNQNDFKKAGITNMPTTIQEYTDDLKKLQQTGVNAHPLGIPFAAAEGLSTYWYELTSAFGGSVLGDKNQPLFTDPSSPGYKAMQWMVDAYKTGLVPKENINITDSSEFQSEMAKHKVSTIFSDYSGNIGSIYDVASESNVVNQVQYIPTPGINGVGSNLGNPDGMGIPKTAKYPGAAAEFLKWYTSKQVQADLSGLNGASAGSIVGFPMRSSSMEMLTQANKVVQGKELVDLFKNHSAPVFKNGGPSWYSQFSSAVYTNIHSAALGQEAVDQAVKAIANTVNQLNQ